MSREDLSAFFEKLQTDAELQEKARALFGAEDREGALCTLAADEGFTFTVEELRAEQAHPSVASLDDDTLKEVVGGFCGVSGAVSGYSSGGSGSIEPMG
jgi:predicted ribosomally synthesized peptide with nif11-like leader